MARSGKESEAAAVVPLLRNCRNRDGRGGQRQRPLLTFACCRVQRLTVPGPQEHGPDHEISDSDNNGKNQVMRMLTEPDAVNDRDRAENEGERDYGHSTPDVANGRRLRRSRL